LYFLIRSTRKSISTSPREPLFLVAHPALAAR